MQTSRRETGQCHDVLSSRGGAPKPLSLRQRLTLSALVAGVSLLIRVVELIPARRRSRVI